MLLDVLIEGELDVALEPGRDGLEHSLTSTVDCAGEDAEWSVETMTGHLMRKGTDGRDRRRWRERGGRQKCGIQWMYTEKTRCDGMVRKGLLCGLLRLMRTNMHSFNRCVMFHWVQELR